MSNPTPFNYTGTVNLEVMAEAVRYNAYLLALVRNVAGGCRRIIDFGAGIGTFASALATQGIKVACIEPDRDQLAVIRKTGMEAHASIDDLPDGGADLVYSFNVLEHIQDDESALKSIRSKLRAGGRVLIYVPAFLMLYSDMDRKVGHVRRYTKGELTRKMVAAGFHVERAEYADSIGFAAALVYRWLDRSEGKVNPRALALYDRFAFPLSRLLDRAGLCRLLGKNVVAHGIAR